MRFEELSKEHQEFLMYCLSNYIKSKIKREGIVDIIEPTYEEYKEFFDEFDEEYEKLLMGVLSRKLVTDFL